MEPKTKKGQRGGPRANSGRKKGTPNKVTRDVREALGQLAESNAPRVQEWLERIAIDAPDKALDLYLKLCEYHVPKLARTEHTGKDGGPLVVSMDRADASA